MKKTLKNNVISAGIALAVFAFILALAPGHASAQWSGGYGNNNNGGYNGGYSYGGNYRNGGYNYGGYGGGYNYGGYNNYPPAPSPRTIPTVQVVYPNGYFYNYYVPTVRYFPAGGYGYGSNRNCSYYSPCM
ncbi:MAG: hypothetical protein WCV82_01290 [Candidatus Paceibacterota bacterium]